MAAPTIEQIREAIAAATKPNQAIRMTVGQFRTLVGPKPHPAAAMVIEAHGAAPKLIIYPAAVNFRPDLVPLEDREEPDTARDDQ